ncbi:hypothetical protein NVS55_36295 [Myxococcus stipitatus]|uniref:hypothetical protein n=1 Tax=Myxococcus stipitatus TaxID=83455 RepID=UPI003144E929
MPPLRMDVLTQHFNEAEFLWSQWERALCSPDFELSELGELEERLLAHVDGLVLGGPHVANELLLPALEADTVDPVASAAFVLLSANEAWALGEVLDVFDKGDDVQRAGVGRALGLCGQEEVEAALRQRLSAEEVALRVAAFRVLAFRGAVPVETQVAWLYRDEPAQVIAALEDTPPLRKDIVQSVLPQLLVDPRPGVRDAAILAGLGSGARAAWTACRKALEQGGKGRVACWLALALGGESQDLERLVALSGREDRARGGAVGLGVLGTGHGRGGVSGLDG